MRPCLRSRDLLLALVLTVLVLVGGVPGGPPPAGAQAAVRSGASAVAARDRYTPQIPARAIAYHRAGYLLLLSWPIWNLIGLWLLLRTGLSAWLRDQALQMSRAQARAGGLSPPLLVSALCFALYTAIMAIWALPCGLAGLGLEHHFGFSHESVSAYLGDEGRTWAIGLAVIPVMWGAYWLLARTPRRWWLWLAVAMAPLLFCTIVLEPVLIAPRFNHYTPLPAGPLRNRILGLASRAGITGAHVFVEDTSRRTTHVNAYVTGLGPSTRIVIDDTALKELPEDQLMAMVGHEMGHYVEGHIWVGFASATVGVALFLWAASWFLPWGLRRWGPAWRVHALNDPAALPFLMLTLSLFLLLQEPVANLESRYLEHRADAFGLRMTHLNDATARLFVGFAERDLSDPSPPLLLHLWFGTHPTLSERIAFARSFRPLF